MTKIVLCIEVRCVHIKTLETKSLDNRLDWKSLDNEEFQNSKVLGKCHFLPGGGAPENWGGIRSFFLDQKGGSKDFSNKKGGITYIF